MFLWVFVEMLYPWSDPISAESPTVYDNTCAAACVLHCEVWQIPGVCCCADRTPFKPILLAYKILAMFIFLSSKQFIYLTAPLANGCYRIHISLNVVPAALSPSQPSVNAGEGPNTRAQPVWPGWLGSEVWKLTWLDDQQLHYSAYILRQHHLLSMSQ